MTDPVTGEADMDHQEQHHEHHRKEREHHKEERKRHEHEQERQPGTIHPAWFLVLGIILVFGVVAVWTWVL
jgi:hypothetical protein